MRDIFHGRTRAQETVLRAGFLVAGSYYLYLAIATVRRGEIRFHIPSHTFKGSNEAAVFWLICAFYALVFVIGVIVSLKPRRNA
jgi:hypothetical protein